MGRCSADARIPSVESVDSADEGTSDMTWNETRRRQDVLREVKAIAAVRQDGELPWSDDYADAFTGPDDLMRDLAHTWRVHVEAQIDTNLTEAEMEERWDALHRAFPGIPQIIDARHVPGRHAHELAA